MPRFMVPVSMRTINGTVWPVMVVVKATSSGSVVRLGKSLNLAASPLATGAGCAFGSAGAGAAGLSASFGRYTYWTTVFAEQLASSGGPRVVPPGSLNSLVWQMKGCCQGPEKTGPVIG